MRTHVKLCDLNTSVPVVDDRSIEVLTSGLPMHHGAQLAVDITLRSAVTSFGAACPNASAVNGAVLERARVVKENKYHELLDGGRCHLVVVGLETGGRWSVEALNFIERLASGRASTPEAFIVSGMATQTPMLSISCSRAFAGSLISSQADALEGVEGAVPDLADLFGQFC